MKKYFWVISFFFTVLINAQESIEQIGFDYFFKNIIINEFQSQNVKIKFSGKTEPTTSGSLTSVECLDRNESKTLIDSGFKESSIIKINDNGFIDEFNKCKKGRRRKIVLSVYKNLTINDNKIILLSLYEKKRRTYYYYIKVDKNLNVLNWCKVISLH